MYVSAITYVSLSFFITDSCNAGRETYPENLREGILREMGTARSMAGRPDRYIRTALLVKIPSVIYVDYCLV